MSEDAWRRSATKDVLFPDDLPGRGPVRVVGEPLKAEDVDTETVKYGTVAALHDSHAADFMVTPVALREQIADAWENGSSTIEVTEATRGPNDHDEWEFEFRDPADHG